MYVLQKLKNEQFQFSSVFNAFVNYSKCSVITCLQFSHKACTMQVLISFAAYGFRSDYRRRLGDFGTKPQTSWPVRFCIQQFKVKQFSKLLKLYTRYVVQCMQGRKADSVGLARVPMNVLYNFCTETIWIPPHLVTINLAKKMKRCACIQ